MDSTWLKSMVALTRTTDLPGPRMASSIVCAWAAVAASYLRAMASGSSPLVMPSTERIWPLVSVTVTLAGSRSGTPEATVCMMARTVELSIRAFVPTSTEALASC
ncbi:MAG: hypothetical protein R2755_34665 [Acidimicrobiales bacterium]